MGLVRELLEECLAFLVVVASGPLGLVVASCLVGHLAFHPYLVALVVVALAYLVACFVLVGIVVHLVFVGCMVFCHLVLLVLFPSCFSQSC